MKRVVLSCFILVFTVSLIFIFDSADIFAKSKQELEEELNKIEEEINALEKDLASTRTAKQTLESRIRYLRGEQAQLSLEIKSANLQIDNFEVKIIDSKVVIEDTSGQLDELYNELESLLRLLYRQEQKSLLEVFIEDINFTEYFEGLKDLELISGNIARAANDLEEQKNFLESKITELDSYLVDTKHLVSIQTLQKERLYNKTAAEKGLLKITKGKEENYQASINESKKRADKIRYQIYDLLGISRQITFGEAVEVANWASGHTGVRPAFLLAILTQESNLGRNVGTCNRVGDPPEKGWKEIMKPTRDQEPFLAITKELGIDPDITPVSCPMRDKNGNRIGWGGAMGPAQFIPSTWIGYQDRLRSLLSKKPNPWDIRDAFLASALLLRDNGAVQNRDDAEWRAALRYFSGSVNTRFRWYADNVLKLTEEYQADIDLLSQ